MKKFVSGIIALACIGLLLMPTFVMGKMVYDEYDTSVEFRMEMYSREWHYEYVDMGINWNWTCKAQEAYAEVTPQYLGFLGIWYSKETKNCQANLGNVYCFRWKNANTGRGTWRFHFLAKNNDRHDIWGYTRLLSEQEV